jgi:hypothetical protein
MAHGLRLASLERASTDDPNAYAEYLGPRLRVRLVYEGRERAMWLESARTQGAEVISRWVDVEWSLAGERLPLDRDLSDTRVDRLAVALERFLARSG